MKLKSKSFNFMQRTDALLKMMATAKGVTETEIIEEALEQFADENILTFINSMYGEKVDRDTIRADRKRKKNITCSYRRRYNRVSNHRRDNI